MGPIVYSAKGAYPYLGSQFAVCGSMVISSCSEANCEPLASAKGTLSTSAAARSQGGHLTAPRPMRPPSAWLACVVEDDEDLAVAPFTLGQAPSIHASQMMLVQSPGLSIAPRHSPVSRSNIVMTGCVSVLGSCSPTNRVCAFAVTFPGRRS